MSALQDSENKFFETYVQKNLALNDLKQAFYDQMVDLSSLSSAADYAAQAAASAAAASAVVLSNEPVRHSIRPSLLLDFANSKRLDPRITFTRASAGTYFDSKGVMQTAAAGVPRFDHNPTTGESLGLLIEEQRTNLLTYSAQFDNAAWTKSNATITANAEIAPDGTLSADKIVDNLTSGVHIAYQSSTFSGSTTYTLSCYAKAGEITSLNLFNNVTTSGGLTAFDAVFNLSNGTVTSVANGGLATITPVGNGWYRCAVTNTVGTGASANTQFRLVSGGSTSYVGNEYSGIYIWGAQLEAGAFATSYIPTTSAQVTRSADSASITGTNFSSFWRPDEGTVYCEFDVINKNSGRVVSAYGAERIFDIYRHAISSSLLNYKYSDVSETSLGNMSASSNKLAMRYKVNDYIASINGVIGGADTSTNGLTSGITTLGIGNYSGVAHGCVRIKKIALYQLGLTNAELQAITA